MLPTWEKNKIDVVIFIIFNLEILQCQLTCKLISYHVSLTYFFKKQGWQINSKCIFATVIQYIILNVD
jgi:hypothetical protein